MGGTLGVGIVGGGNVTTRYHLPAHRELGDRVRVVALADTEPARLAEAQSVAGRHILCEKVLRQRLYTAQPQP